MRTLPKQKIADMNRFDLGVMVLGFIEPLFTVPQLIQIFATQNAGGLSIITWGLYVFSSVVMIVWGIKRQLPPIYIPQLFWIVLEVIIIYGILKYG